MLQAPCQGGRRGFGVIPVAWMPGLIILRHLSALRVRCRDQLRLQHDVTPPPIRVLADFILTQPARPDIRIQNWAFWRAWARQSEVICNPTDTTPSYRHDWTVMSCLHPSSPGPGNGNLEIGHGTGSGKRGLGLEQDIITAWRLSLSALSRRGLGRCSDALCAITSLSS